MIGSPLKRAYAPIDTAVTIDRELAPVDGVGFAMSGASAKSVAAAGLAVASDVRSRRTVSRRWLFGADVATPLIVSVLADVFDPRLGRSGVDLFGVHVPYLTAALLLACAWVCAIAVGGGYATQLAVPLRQQVRSSVIAGVRLLATVACISLIFRAPISWILAAGVLPGVVVADLFLRAATRPVMARVRPDLAALTRVVLVGEGPAVQRFASHLSSERASGCDVVGACTTFSETEMVDRQLLAGGVQVLGTPDEVVRIARAVGADGVAVVGRPGLSALTLQELGWQLEDSGVDFYVAPDITVLSGPRVGAVSLAGLPMLHIGPARVSGAARYVKSIYERLIAAVLLLVSLPLLLVAAAAIMIDSGRPLFYRQRRVGFNGREFTMVKFRTMVRDADQLLDGLLAENEHDGALFKIRNDPRVTRVGRLLRKFSVDELPQLLNVLKGDMVLIGPRPCLPREAEQFDAAAQRRFLARPGLTGLWQVSGRSDLAWEDAVRLDLYYVENWSFLLDLQILWKTVQVVLAGRGAY